MVVMVVESDVNSEIFVRFPTNFIQPQIGSVREPFSTFMLARKQSLTGIQYLA